MLTYVLCTIYTHFPRATPINVRLPRVHETFTAERDGNRIPISWS